ncbi:hypothetical protein NEFER01_1972 [Nematocida sp. LUAm1]|nr:hypothetical protein NEFER02_1854 [Nematocida sp. LUAm2]KAI5179105.1 hypothetical protein NEFER01_1972 [Nematocida sp. LUAm1]
MVILQHTDKSTNTLSAYSFVETLFKVLTTQAGGLILSILGYLAFEGIFFGVLLIYFGINSCLLLVILLLRLTFYELSQKNIKEKTVKKSLDTEMPFEKKEDKPVEREKKENAPKVSFSIPLRRRNKVQVFPTKPIIRKYGEYKKEFKLSKELEKKFRAWMLTNVISVVVKSEGSLEGRKYASKPLSKQEQEEIKLILNNGFICYDKRNDIHNQALFKIFYNYFNSIMPRAGSYYANPMDDFIFENLQTPRISAFGLLIEDTDSLLERKKVFNVYFMNKNILYDTEGDVTLSFLLLFVFANISTGQYLGSLSLRNIEFLPK